jgi:hypothetical protein
VSSTHLNQVLAELIQKQRGTSGYEPGNHRLLPVGNSGGKPGLVRLTIFLKGPNSRRLSIT